ncbi:MAG: transcription termination/antitermination protein NusA [Candidatus Pacebacteria bacterium]|nr:transcription termination/antitermination protein NusA [Candidatus Paceibacterota bacterium]
MEHKQFVSAIEQICEEKAISNEKAIEIVEASLAAAYKKEYGKKGQTIKVNFDEISGSMEVFQIKVVADEDEESDENEDGITEDELDENGERIIKRKFSVDKNITIEEAKEYKKNPEIDDEIEIPLPPKDDFGRIAAQTAKQVMIQKIREAEKESIFDEFKDKEGEVANGVVQRIEGRNVFVDIGKAVGIIYPVEQIAGERYNIGQRLKVFIVRIDREAKEANLVLSRTNSEIIKKLFELEVPEIFSKTVEIKSIAREAGSRTKVAVFSNEDGIDPVGSCVGQRGSRIQTIINELGGEKIDITEWSDNSSKFIQNALSPAKVVHLDIDEAKMHAVAYVEEDQLSLAIGKQGQNVRLAAKLTGWKIDILEDKKKIAVEEITKEDDKDEKEIEEKVEKKEETSKETDTEKSEKEEGVEKETKVKKKKKKIDKKADKK